MARSQAQPSAALDAVLADKDLAPLLLRPLLVTDAAWSVTDVARTLARVECVCRALRRAVEPLWWRALVVQRWPSAALVMPRRGPPAAAAPPGPGAWRMLYRQRHVAALGAPPINAQPSATPSLSMYDFSVELTLDGQPFASRLLPGMHAHTGVACRFFSDEPPWAAQGAVGAPAATTVAYELSLRRNDNRARQAPLDSVMQVVLRLALDRPPARTVDELVQEFFGASAADVPSLVLRGVTLEFSNRYPRERAPGLEAVHPDAVHAALASLQWEREVLPPRRASLPPWEPRHLPYWAFDR
jgi:hypothetical protein